MERVMPPSELRTVRVRSSSASTSVSNGGCIPMSMPMTICASSSKYPLPDQNVMLFCSRTVPRGIPSSSQRSTV